MIIILLNCKNMDCRWLETFKLAKWAAKRMRMIKKLRQQGDLERWHLGNQLRTEAERQTSSNELVGKILRELTKDVKKEDRMNAEYLQRLEQQRISQAASTSALFSDRSEMIKQMAEEAERKAEEVWQARLRRSTVAYTLTCNKCFAHC